MTSSSSQRPALFQQPKAVWAVAFACVISFMGIGLVDPILPALASGLQASPTMVSLLFTSYLIVTAVAMLGVGWVSSRIGAKWALVVGLALIVVFAALAGAAGSIWQIIGFRGGWGLGNALFISTSLAAIVALARGGFSGAIILYEAALGLGIAAGPLVGGLLGSISWRGPFFGVAVLMGIALVASLVFIPSLPRPAEKVSLRAPLAALRHRALLTMSIMALLYNWGFFTMLGYAPYPMELDAFHLGLVFTAWGLLVAAFAVFCAPRLQRRFGTVAVLFANLLCLSIVMLVIAVGIHTPSVVVGAVIVSGAFIGINNTLTTQAVMLVSPVTPAVASSAYGFVRFIGGGLAPFVAGKIAEATAPSMAFVVGAAAFLIAIPVLMSGRRQVTAAEQPKPEAVQATESAAALHRVGEVEPEPGRPVVVAIDAGTGDQVMIAATAIARAENAPLEVVHVRETEIVEELAIETGSGAEAKAIVASHVNQAVRNGLRAYGYVLTSIGTHAEAGRVLSEHCDQVRARVVVTGRSQDRTTLGRMVAARLSGEIRPRSDRSLVLVDPATGKAEQVAVPRYRP